jgi:uncharacterized cupredoxin-like copper-binding protein
MNRTLVVAAAALTLVVAGCGSDNNSSSSSSTGASTPPSQTTAKSGGAPSGGKATNLKIAADPSGQLKFDKSKLSAKAGKVTIVMDNPSSLPHAVEIEGNGVETKGSVVMKGGKSTASANLKAGKYEFYCPVDGHKQAGMEGTLTVK